MRPSTLGLILAALGAFGGIVGYTSIIIYNDIAFVKVGILGNVIQLVGIALIYLDRIDLSGDPRPFG